MCVVSREPLFFRDGSSSGDTQEHGEEERPRDVQGKIAAGTAEREWRALVKKSGCELWFIYRKRIPRGERGFTQF